VPWAGRTLTDQPFAGDDGSADPALTAALDACRAAAAPAAGDPAALVAAVVDAWMPSRVLVPVRAVLGEGEELVAVAGDKSADMALAVLLAPDGALVLPVFGSAAALARWDPTTRPVPVEAARAAQAAVAEGCTAVVIDPAGPVPCLLPRPVVWAVAQGRRWTPPADDPEVVAAVAAACAGIAVLTPDACLPDGVAGLTVRVELAPGLSTAELTGLTGRLSAALAADELIAERVDRLRLVPIARSY
jgi:hypothetical protein